MAVADRRQAKVADVGAFMGELYGTDLHAKRVESLAGATLGVMPVCLACSRHDRPSTRAG